MEGERKLSRKKQRQHSVDPQDVISSGSTEVKQLITTKDIEDIIYQIASRKPSIQQNLDRVKSNEISQKIYSIQLKVDSLLGITTLDELKDNPEWVKLIDRLSPK